MLMQREQVILTYRRRFSGSDVSPTITEVVHLFRVDLTVSYRPSVGLQNVRVLVFAFLHVRQTSFLTKITQICVFVSHFGTKYVGC